MNHNGTEQGSTIAAGLGINGPITGSGQSASERTRSLHTMDEGRQTTPRILVWKWDLPDIQTKRYRKHIDDFTSRSSFDSVHLFLCYHFWEYSHMDQFVRDAVRDAAERLQAKGWRLFLNLDTRECRRYFSEEFPEDCVERVYPVEFTLDEDGAGYGLLMSAPLWYAPHIAHRAIRAWCMKKTDEEHYDPATRIDITKQCQLWGAAPGQGVVRCLLGKEFAGQSVYVLVAVRSSACDYFSPKQLDFMGQVFSLYQEEGVPLAGVCLDEWGVGFPDPSEYRIWHRLPLWSDHLAPRYSERMGGDAAEGYLHMRLAPVGDDGVRVRAIDHYFDLLRESMVSVEEHFYTLAKKTLGPDAFVGSHPTWLCDGSWEIFHNGLDWWDVPRDHGQTDEEAIYPVRMALAHKRGGRPWINMWYSMMTLDIRTYFAETWENARYGGRTSSHGYRVPAEEWAVLQLSEDNHLERLSTLQDRIILLDQVQESLPDCRLAIVLGIPACCNWTTQCGFNDDWSKDRGPLVEAYHIAGEVWNAGFLCDLIASYELDDGDLEVLPDGRLHYGVQTFDAWIYLFPQFGKESTWLKLMASLEQGGKGSVLGACTCDFEGKEALAQIRSLTARCDVFYPSWPGIDELKAMLTGCFGLKPNDIPQGCRFIDGMVVVAARKDQETGNPIPIDFEIHGHRVRAEAKDLFAIRLADNGQCDRLAAIDMTWLEIDGLRVLSSPGPRDYLVVDGVGIDPGPRPRKPSWGPSPYSKDNVEP